MIFVDTSVWVAAFRSSSGNEARRLQQLLDEDQVGLPIVVRLEILSGAAKTDRNRLYRALSALPVYFPTAETWDRIEAWVGEASVTGQHFGVIDLLIAALAKQHDAALWSLDRDFNRMARLGFVQAYSDR